jgi:hypothetical protein
MVTIRRIKRFTELVSVDHGHGGISASAIDEAASLAFYLLISGVSMG